MSVIEIEAAVRQLSKDELNHFNEWYEEYLGDQWDCRIESDVLSGKFEEICNRVDTAFVAGQCTEL